MDDLEVETLCNEINEYLDKHPSEDVTDPGVAGRYYNSVEELNGYFANTENEELKDLISATQARLIEAVESY